MPKRKTHEQYVDQLNRAKPGYTLLTQYKSSRHKVTVRHEECGTIFNPLADNLLKRSGCPICARKAFGKHKRPSKEQFRELFKRVFGDEYTLLSDYVRSTEKVMVRHNKCNHNYEVLPGNAIHKGSGCPRCYSSKGEKLVERTLEELSVKFKKQHTFVDCVDRGRLKFDFAIIDDSNAVKALIEFDGEQHFKPKLAFGGVEEFRNTKRRDQIKDKYCEDSGIPLLRIPFFNVDKTKEIVKEFIREAC